jgi:hypothetical protein
VQALIDFMNGGLGRGARVVLGVALIALGLLVVRGTAGAVVAAAGLVPIVMGAWGHCLIEAVVRPPGPRAR